MSSGLPEMAVDPVVSKVAKMEEKAKTKIKKKISPYRRKYNAAFRRVSSKFQNKKGEWLKDGFRRAVRAAHKEAKK